MTLDDTFFEWLFKLTVGGILGVGAWMWRNLVGDVRGIERNQSRIELEIEKNFVRNTSIERFHNRLDDIETDIKTLIRTVAEK